MSIIIGYLVKTLTLPGFLFRTFLMSLLFKEMNIQTGEIKYFNLNSDLPIEFKLTLDFPL